jgi:hypothetical protein
VTTVGEAAANANGQLSGVLNSGLNFLSANDSVTFLLYKRVVLPLDGYVFWLRANLAPPVPIEPDTVIVKGSLHYSTEIAQEEDSTIGYNTIVFTAQSAVDAFQVISPQLMYIGTYQGIRFAFSSNGKYYEQAGLWHYLGVAVTSLTNIQIIDDLSQLPQNQIVSNSLPIWLAMPTYKPPYPGFTCPITLFPSFLIPQNESPPYGAVHIEDTKSLVEVATLGPRLQSHQLATEKVRITLYGCNNKVTIDFLNFCTQYIYDWYFIGMRNLPVINDLKREQAELQVITQKKEILFEINYLQHLVRDLARQHILSAIVNSEASNVPPIVIPPQPFKKSKFSTRARTKITEALHVRS